MKKLLLLFFILVIAAIFIIKPYVSFVTQTLHISFLKTLFPGRTLATTNNQVNILILGIGGGAHDGPNLSDSIIVANYNRTANRLTTVGIPRDVWSETLRDRINSAYAYGVAKGDEKTGLKLAKAAVENIIDQPIHYAVVINFDKFKSLIDYVDGVDITVQRSFTDHEFPIAGRENDTCGGKDPDFKCRYETVTFEKGPQHMDGDRALKFVRSRHAVGAEGNDFARSERQQLVLSALKDKMTRIGLSRNMDKIEGLYKKIDDSLVRDISNQQLAILAKNIILKKKFNQQNRFLPEDLFEVPPAYKYDGKYVLIPKNNKLEVLRVYFACLISGREKC